MLIIWFLCVCWWHGAAADLKFAAGSDCQHDDECVEIRQCPFFVALLDHTRIPRPKHVIRIIRERQCGFIGNVPKVCCAPQTPPPPQPQPLQLPPIAAVLATHANIKYVPNEICGQIASRPRITGGQASTLMEFPWMALLAYMTDDGLDFRCGGTVINERYVLTAAHCVLNLTLVGVRLGENNVNTRQDCDGTWCAPPVQDFYIDSVLVHPGYVVKTFANDIALVKLATAANFSFDNVRPICLPLAEPATYRFDGKTSYVAGWGITETGFKSPELRKVSMPIISHAECTNVYKKHAPIDQKQLCAGGTMGKDSCGGDSGGPLKMIQVVDGRPRYVQHGIVSYGPRQCGAEGQPGVYTNVGAYMDWILDNISFV